MSLKIQAVIQYSLNEKANDIGEYRCGDKISLEIPCRHEKSRKDWKYERKTAFYSYAQTNEANLKKTEEKHCERRSMLA